MCGVRRKGGDHGKTGLCFYRGRERACAGLGQGLGTVNASPLVSSWFDGKERSYALTLNSMSSMIAIALTVAIIRPLSAALGGWQMAYLAYAAFTLVFVVLWMVFGRSNPELEAQAVQKSRWQPPWAKAPALSASLSMSPSVGSA